VPKGGIVVRMTVQVLRMEAPSITNAKDQIHNGSRRRTQVVSIADFSIAFLLFDAGSVGEHIADTAQRKPRHRASV